MLIMLHICGWDFHDTFSYTHVKVLEPKNARYSMGGLTYSRVGTLTGKLIIIYHYAGAGIFGKGISPFHLHLPHTVITIGDPFSFFT